MFFKILWKRVFRLAETETSNIDIMDLLVLTTKNKGRVSLWGQVNRQKNKF